MSRYEQIISLIRETDKNFYDNLISENDDFRERCQVIADACSEIGFENDAKMFNFFQSDDWSQNKPNLVNKTILYFFFLKNKDDYPLSSCLDA